MSPSVIVLRSQDQQPVHSAKNKRIILQIRFIRTHISESASNMAIPSDRSASSLISTETVMKTLPKKSKIALARASDISLMFLVYLAVGMG